MILKMNLINWLKTKKKSNSKIEMNIIKRWIFDHIRLDKIKKSLYSIMDEVTHTDDNM